MSNHSETQLTEYQQNAIVRAFIETKHRRVGQLQIHIDSGKISQDKGFHDAMHKPIIYAELQKTDAVEVGSIFVITEKPNGKFQFKKFESFDDVDFDKFDIYKPIATDRLNAYNELKYQVDAYVTANTIWSQVEYHNENL